MRQGHTACALVSRRVAISTFAVPSVANNTILALTTRQYGSVRTDWRFLGPQRSGSGFGANV
ncbi:MAG: hypothetical protein ACYC1D_16970 [Acidimicrobiales bacterium]